MFTSRCAGALILKRGLQRPPRGAAATTLLLLLGTVALAQGPDHPIITEVYNNPNGDNDGPAGRDPANDDQEYIEVYLPTCAELDPTLDCGDPMVNCGVASCCDCLNLTFYEVEGDADSSGNALVNYRFDLPTLDLDPSNGTTSGAVGTHSNGRSGIVVLGWVDYEPNDMGTCESDGASCSVFAQDCAIGRCKGDGSLCSVSAQDCTDLSLCRPDCVPVLSDLAGATPNDRIGLVDGGITGTTDYVFIAINGHHYTGTTNFPVLTAENLIDLPKEARSGLVQNGSNAYLLVNRDATGYVELCDDKHATDCGAAGADPNLASGSVLAIGALFDGLAGNDGTDCEWLCDGGANDLKACTSASDCLPGGVCKLLNCSDLDLQVVLPAGGAFTPLIPQILEGDNSRLTPSLGGGYARRYVDVPKTTETPAADDPVADAFEAYRLIRNNGPFFPTPGRVVLTTSPPELSLVLAEPVFDVLSKTTGRPSLLTANVGGASGIDISVTDGGTSSDSTVATFAPGSAATNVAGQSFAFPTIAIEGKASAADGATASSVVTLTATGDPTIINPIQTTTVTARVLNPTTGLDAGGLPLETTVFVAVQSVPENPGVANELLSTSLAAFLATQPDVAALETWGNWSVSCHLPIPGPCLDDPATDISSSLVVGPMIKELPGDGEECVTWLPRPGIPLTGFAQTVANSAEVLSGATTYEASISTCISTQETVIKGIRVNVPDTKTFGGVFSPSEQIHFVEPAGDVGDPCSALTGATTSRTFEIALIDTAVKSGGLETGKTDDFGIVIEVERTETWSPVADGDFVFLSFTGGLQGADIDTLDVPPGNNVATAILLDLDNLHDVLGVISIEAVYIVDAGQSGEVDIIEGFSLNLDVTCTTPADCSDGNDCTDDACEGGVCQYTSNTAPCEDGLKCNGAETCSGGSCQPGIDLCPGQACDELTQTCWPLSCDPPTVVPEGCRYLEIIPAPGTEPVALLVVGHPSDPAVACVSRYVQADGTLGMTPVLQTPAQWGTVHARGTEIIPDTRFRAQAECAGGSEQSAFSAVARTWAWGDADNASGVDLDDILLVLDGFQGFYSNATFENVNLFGSGCIPNQVIDLNDVLMVLDAFRRIPYSNSCAGPC